MGSAITAFRASLVYAVSVVAIAGCAPDKPAPKAVESIPEQAFVKALTPSFHADSAYAFVEKQVSFGPRVPNTTAHRQCAQWLQASLKSFGWEVVTQTGTVTAYNGDKLSIYNIMGRYNPEAAERILLCAHWDSRPYADRDKKDMSKAIDGANDGASGVGVLLELARAIGRDSLKPDVGIDIVFFDAEDYGKPESSMQGESNNSWCLGSQYWAKNPPIENYNSRFGILLDMVGAEHAVFPKEGVSMRYAPQVVNKVWRLAQQLGYKNYFVPFEGGAITDDHVYINQILGIPTIDIIHYEVGRSDFGAFHHTHNDNMDIIHKSTLGVVGDVVMQVVYLEK